MNQNLIDWVFKQELTRSSDKLTLLAFAFNSYRDDLSSPTIASIARQTGMSPLTIMSCTKHLLEGKYIVDTGEKNGKSRIFRFPFEAV